MGGGGCDDYLELFLLKKVVAITMFLYFLLSYFFYKNDFN